MSSFFPSYSPSFLVESQQTIRSLISISMPCCNSRQKLIFKLLALRILDMNLIYKYLLHSSWYLSLSEHINWTCSMFYQVQTDNIPSFVWERSVPHSIFIYHKSGDFWDTIIITVLEESESNLQNQSLQLCACLVKEVIKVIRLFILSPSNRKFMFLISLNLGQKTLFWAQWDGQLRDLIEQVVS